MILAVLGTHEQPFPRAARLAATLASEGEELVVQHGHTPPVAAVPALWVAWRTREELDELIRAARVVVVHGGSGCIFQAIRAGARPVVVPRLARFAEHVDDHQLQLGGRLERAGQVVVWREGEDAATLCERLERAGDVVAEPLPADLRPAVWAAAAALSARPHRWGRVKARLRSSIGGLQVMPQGGPGRPGGTGLPRSTRPGSRSP